MKQCLITTGTIISDLPLPEGEDSEVRRLQYLDVLWYYREKLPDYPIYFLENSLYDYTGDKEFQNLFDLGITLIKMPLLADKKAEGKGYREFNMIDHFVRTHPEYDSFIKCTGRYKFHNITDLLKSKLPENGLLIDTYRRNKWCVTNLFACTYNFYNLYLMGIYKEVNDTNHQAIERRIWKKIVYNNLWDNVRMFDISPEYTIPFSDRNHFEAWRVAMNIGTDIERTVMKAVGQEQIIL